MVAFFWWGPRKKGMEIIKSGRARLEGIILRYLIVVTTITTIYALTPLINIMIVIYIGSISSFTIFVIRFGLSNFGGRTTITWSASARTRFYGGGIFLQIPVPGGHSEGGGG